MAETIHIGEYKAVEVAKASNRAGGEIVFREEQKRAIDDAIERYKTGGKKFLWNAKMRFGKTLCALELARRMGEVRTQKRVRRTIIVTHRPVLGESWHEDYTKIFGDTNPNYRFATKFDDGNDEGSFTELDRWVEQNADTAHLIFFASMQYLRGSKSVGGSNRSENELKEAILNAAWDLVVVDEAHEGTQTDLGQNVITKLTDKGERRILHLSGTPFNLIEGFNDKEIFTWDYVQEQEAKAQWQILHPDEPEENNPYRMLPRMEIRTWRLSDLDIGEDQHFEIREFLRVAQGAAAKREGRLGRFVHETEVLKFLDKLCENSDTSLYPFSTDEFRHQLRHTLWVVPGVKEAAALEALLKGHRIFKRFQIINVAGQCDDEEVSHSAIQGVKKKIGRGDDTMTITLACSRLTTGVTIPQWTGVLYLKGSVNTKASPYMQTIFRVQSPWEYLDQRTGEHRMKTLCYVFDFAPDRTLKVIAETAKFRTLTQDQKRYASAKTVSEKDRENITDFFNFCPVIAMGGGMREQRVEDIVEQVYVRLNSVYVEKAVRSGFDDNSVYNIEELMKMDSDLLNKIGEAVGTTEQGKSTKKLDKKNKANPITISDEDLAPTPRGRAKSEEEETPEERQRREEKQRRQEEIRKERDKRIQIIRSIAIRIPLMMFGASGKVNDTITLDNITDPNVVDDRSWREFMPKGATRQMFNSIKKVFSRTVFNESSERYREWAREADAMHMEDRIRCIAKIHACFRNPKSETVLTPWPVVNRHMSDTLGGWCFYDETFKRPNQREVSPEEAAKRGVLFDFEDDPMPRHVDRGEVTRQVFRTNSDERPELNAHILEINSKSGLYPLYLTYSLYRERLKDYLAANLLEEGQQSVEEEQVIWDDVLEKNIYIICNTLMAEYITRRTLVGFRGDDDNDARSRGLKEFDPKRMNIKYEKLIERAKNDRETLISNLRTHGFWHEENSDSEMIKFDAVVSNPPYQNNQSTENCGTNSAFASAVYPMFIELAKGLHPDYVSFITPSRWMTKTGQGIDETWVDEMINSNHFISIHDFYDAMDVFDKVEIKGGVNYFLYADSYDGKCRLYLHQKDKVSLVNAKLNEVGAGIVVRDPFAPSIMDRIKSVHGNYFTNYSFRQLVSPQHFFDKDGLLTTSWKGYALKKDETHTIKYYLNKQVCATGFAWISSSDIPKNREIVPLHKVFLSKAYNGGDSFPHQIIGKSFYGEPNSVCSQTYLVVGYNQEESVLGQEECLNIIKYMATRLFRYLVFIKKKTQDNPSEVFRFVPLQDFTSESDIDWSQNIAQIDQQLYRKYGLSPDEIGFIERMVKPME